MGNSHSIPPPPLTPVIDKFVSSRPLSPSSTSDDVASMYIGPFALHSSPLFLPGEGPFVIVFTGGSRGIGGAAVQALQRAAEREKGAGSEGRIGNRPVLLLHLSRSTSTAPAAATTDGQAGRLRTVHIPCDLASPASVAGAARTIASMVDRVHVLVENAGVFRLFDETAHGYGHGLDSNFAINHLGHFLLYLALEPLLEAGGKEHPTACRVVIVASDSHYSTTGKDIRAKLPLRAAATSLNPHEPYALSKLANVMMGLEVNRRARARGSPIRCHVVHPGALVGTTIASGVGIIAEAGLRVASLFTKSPSSAGAVVLWAALDPELAGRGGHYLDNYAAKMPTVEARDAGMRERLWNMSLELLGETVPTHHSSVAGHTRSRRQSTSTTKGRGRSGSLVPALQPAPAADDGGTSASAPTARRVSRASSKSGNLRSDRRKSASFPPTTVPQASLREDDAE